MRYLRYGKWDLQTTRWGSPRRTTRHTAWKNEWWDTRRLLQNCIGISIWNEEVLKPMLASRGSHTLTLPTSMYMLVYSWHIHIHKCTHIQKQSHTQNHELCIHVNMQRRCTFTDFYVFVDNVGNLFCKMAKPQTWRKKEKKKNLNGGKKYGTKNKLLRVNIKKWSPDFKFHYV